MDIFEILSDVKRQIWTRVENNHYFWKMVIMVMVKMVMVIMVIMVKMVMVTII